jgi:hypothetical protein
MTAALDVLEYHRKLREIYRPAQGQNPPARMGERIKDQLKRRGPLTRRDLRGYTNGRLERA